MRKLSLATLVASLAFVANAAADQSLTNTPSSWQDTRTGKVYSMRCNENQTGSGSTRSESLDCTPTSNKPPAATYDSPNAFWTSDFDGAHAGTVHVVIDGNGHLTGTASNFTTGPTTFNTTWKDTRTGKVYKIVCSETMSRSGNTQHESFNCTPKGAKAPAGSYGAAQNAFWDSDFTPGLHTTDVNVTIDNKGNLTGSANYTF